MLTAVVRMRGEAQGLALTLSSLVPAVAEGLMNHAVVVLDRPDGLAERIADAMGATMLISPADPWSTGAGAARGDWVLLLNAGEEPLPGWIGAVERHLLLQSAARRRPALLPLSGGLEGWRERLSLLTARALARSGAHAGLIAAREAVASGARLPAAARLTPGRLRIQA
jgi:hypothetical protein